MADQSLYKDGSSQGMKGTIVPSSKPPEGANAAEHSGVQFDVHRPVAHNIVEVDAKGNQKVTEISGDQLAALAEKNRTVDGMKNKSCVHYYDMTKQASAAPAQRVIKPVDYDAGISVVQPPKPAAQPTPPPPPPPLEVDMGMTDPVPDPGLPMQYDQEIVVQREIHREPDVSVVQPVRQSQPVQQRAYIPRDQPIVMPSVVPQPPLQEEEEPVDPRKGGANQNLALMKKARVKVRFAGSFGKLAIPYNLVFRDDIALVMMQYSEEGIFYEPPGHTQEVIEVTWGNRLYVCVPGVHFMMPDKKTAFTIFFIDTDATEEKVKRGQVEPGKERIYEV